MQVAVAPLRRRAADRSSRDARRPALPCPALLNCAPQAAYCQGMAFVAGLLLFYVPEEPAFQLFCRLLRC